MTFMSNILFMALEQFLRHRVATYLPPTEGTFAIRSLQFTFNR